MDGCTGPRRRHDSDDDRRAATATPSTITVPEVVRNKASVAGQDEWLTTLPDVVGELCTRWHLDLGVAFGDGTEAWVSAATRHTADGATEDVVLKILVPRDPALARREATVLRIAGGEGCARLLEFDEQRQALLLERLGPSMFSMGLPVRRRHELLCDAAMRLWRPAPEADLPTGSWKAGWLAEQIERSWEQLGRPCSRRTIEHALGAAERRRLAHDDERAQLVHGDVHEWNALRAQDGSFKLVDPDGLLAEPEYDLGIIMREDPVDLMSGDPDERARRLAARTGRDATAIREWGIVERVSTALLCIEIDLQPVGRQMLDAAEWVAAADR